MSFAVNFYTISKEENSTARPSGAGTSYNCRLLDNCSILNPVIALDIGIASFPNYNYCYIPAFNRYYWVGDPVYNASLLVLYLHVDVLATYKNIIGNEELYITRSAYAKDGFIADSFYPLSTECTIEQVTDASPYWWTLSPSVNNGVYVVGILGRIDSSQTAGGITYLVLGPNQFRQFTEALFKDDLSYYDGSNLGISESLAKMIFKPYEYIASVTWLPSEPSNTTISANGWHVGFWSYNQAVKVLNPAATLHFECSYSLSDHPQAATRGKYTNVAPYTQRILRLPRVGAITLDSSVMANLTQITIALDVDPITGAGIYEIYGSGLLIDRVATQIGVSVHLSSTGDISFSDATQSANKVVNGSLMLAGGDVSQLLPAITSIASATDILAPHINLLSSQGGYLGLQGAAIPRLYNVFRKIVDDDNARHGRPLCKLGKPSAYPGYMQILDGAIAISGATKEELTAVKSYLEGGFYYA